MTNEIWKDIEGYEGLYQISSHGRVKSLDRLNSLGHKLKGRVLSLTLQTKGYVTVSLSQNGKATRFYTHRLVAQAFIPNPQNKPQINHIDEIKDNNNISNLEWVTASENINYGSRNTKHSEKLSSPVKAICVKTNKELHFKSFTEAFKQLGVNYGSISHVIKGNRTTAGGYRWELTS